MANEHSQVKIHSGNWAKTIFTHGKWYMLSSIATKLMLFFLLPIYTRYFSTEEYGTLNTLNSIAQFLGVGISLSLDSAFGRFYHSVVDDKKELQKLISTIYSMILLWGAVIVSIMLISSYFWAQPLLHIRVWPYIFLSFLPQIFLQLANIGLSYLRQTLRIKLLTILQFFTNLVGISLTIYLIVAKGMSIEARLLGNALVTMCLFFVSMGMLMHRGYLKFGIDIHLLWNLLKYSLPLIPLTVGGWIAGLSDRIIISRYDSLSSTGIYAFAFQIAHVAYVMQDAVTQVVGPVSMSGLIHEKELTTRKILRLSQLLFVFMLLFCFGLFLFSKDIVSVLLLLGKGRTEYLDSANLIFIIALTYVFSSQYRLFSDFISYHKKTWITSSGGILMAVINLLLNLLLIPHYGRTAAAYTTTVATLFYSLWLLYWSIRLEKFSFKPMFYIVCMLFYTVLILGISFASPELLEVNLQNFIFKCLLCTVLLFFIFILCKKMRLL